jgi:hypothetical protein
VQPRERECNRDSEFIRSVIVLSESRLRDAPGPVSRFTDFLPSDGEKPWRRGDEEFDQRNVTSAELQNKWNDGWNVLFRTLDALKDDDLHLLVTIRGEQFTAREALHRSVTHTAYHVGQIVNIAKTQLGSDWKTLTIPRGKSQEYNADPKGQRP